MENRIRNFSVEVSGQRVDVSLHEDEQGWPSITAEFGEGQVQRHDRGATHEEVLIRGLGPGVGISAVRELRRIQG